MKLFPISKCSSSFTGYSAWLEPDEALLIIFLLNFSFFGETALFGDDPRYLFSPYDKKKNSYFFFEKSKIRTFHKNSKN